MNDTLWDTLTMSFFFAVTTWGTERTLSFKKSKVMMLRQHSFLRQGSSGVTLHTRDPTIRGCFHVLTIRIVLGILCSSSADNKR